MNDLLQKLEAAIAETERIAREAAGKLPHWVRGGRGDASSIYARNPAGRCPNHPADGANPCDDEFLAEFGDGLGAEAEAIAGHVVHNDPIRVLRRVARDRKLLETYVEARDYYSRHPSAPAGEVHGLWKAVLLLAEDYEIEVSDRG